MNISQHNFRVLFPFVGDTIGGSHISALTLFRQLEVNHSISPVVSVMAQGQLSEYLTANGVSFRRSPQLSGRLDWGLRRGFILAVISAPRLIRWLKSERINIVHTHDFRMHVLWGIACRFSGVKQVLHLRSPTKPSLSIALLFFLASRVVSVSEFSRKSVGAKLGKKITVIRNPVENFGHRDLSQEARAELLLKIGADKAEFLIGWAANFLERKRPQDFVELAKRVSSASDLDIRFLMFGNNSTELGQRLTEVIRREGLQEKVITLGWNADFSRLAAGLDLLVATSEEESFGRTLVEGLLARVPVVATEIGGHVEALDGGRFGSTFPTGDVGKLHDLVMSHLRNPQESDGKAETAFSVLSKRHSPKEHALQIGELYSNLMNRLT